MTLTKEGTGAVDKGSVPVPPVCDWVVVLSACGSGETDSSRSQEYKLGDSGFPLFSVPLLLTEVISQTNSLNAPPKLCFQEDTGEFI